ncbi:uncharacterized protein LOC143286159 [Babylonia areolata]|uniref:uncharacterized protein LOC143286159 n=1 Tax=Babylonia areolata TaxID=304850 RepID=UPI003FD5F955
MSVSSNRGRSHSASRSLGRTRWKTVSESSKGSGVNEVFDDIYSPTSKSVQQGKVFTVDNTMRYSRSHILRYGTTRSMPEDHRHNNHHHNNTTSYQNGNVISNGSATTGRRLYSSNPRGRAPARRIFSSSSGGGGGGGGGGSHFRRSALEKKEDAVSFFDIEMDKSPFYQYRPGEEISGAVHMDIHHNVEIRFVELVIVGQGSTTVLKSRQGLPVTVRESYLRKQTFVIGTLDAMWSSVLTPGHYVSRFKFRLPKDLPSTIVHDDLSSGFKMDISYHIKARICDDVGGSSVRSNSSGNHHHQLVKVLLSKKQPFRIQRPFDLNLVPSATTPVSHTEEVYLSCAGNNQVVVTLHLERAVFLAGDDIKLHLAATVPPSQRIKTIACRLQQHLKLDRHQEVTTFTLSNVERADPQSTSDPGDETSSYDVTLPTQTNLVTSFLQGCHMLRVSYTLAIEMRFVPAGGKLSFTIPLGIGPCAEPIYAEKLSSRKAVPIFNRPTRFPCFSPTPVKSPPLQVDRSTSRSSQSINVVTKYSNSVWAKCFLCCLTSGDVD